MIVLNQNMFNQNNKDAFKPNGNKTIWAGRNETEHVHADTRIVDEQFTDKTSSENDPTYEQSDNNSTSSDDDVGNTNTIDHEEIVNTVKTGSKRKRTNKRIQNKRLRMEGKAYMRLKRDNEGISKLCVDKGGRIMEGRSCSKRCENGWGGRKCTHIDEQTRADTFQQFWGCMTWGEKKLYIVNLVDKKETQRKTSTADSSRRKYSYDFYLKKNDTRIKVCQSLFMATFGLKNETVYRWLGEENVVHGIPKSPPSGLPGHNRRTKAQEAAERFLQDIPKIPSHYCRAQSSKTYLETEHTSLRDLYRDFKRQMELSENPVYGISQFTRMFNENNLSFFKPKKDQCDTCCGYKAGNVDEQTYAEHIRKKHEATAAKEADKQNADELRHNVLTMDLQSLLLCPKLQASSLFYKT